MPTIAPASAPAAKVPPHPATTSHSDAASVLIPATPAAPASLGITADYAAALRDWLDRHKTYPASARQRGEEGNAVLRFRVDRTGRVLEHRLTRGTGHPSLDAAIDQMMRGATVPRFPASMTQSEIEVSVAIDFKLTR